MIKYEMKIGDFDKKTETFPWAVEEMHSGKIVKHGYSDSLADAQERMLFIICCRTAQELGHELPDKDKFFASQDYQCEVVKELGFY